MDEHKNALFMESVPNQARANELVTRLFDVAAPGSVFSEPVVHGEYAVITASEVTVAMGVGYGGGGGSAPATGGDKASDGSSASRDSLGAGGGGGGGGTSTARPV